MLRAYEWTDRKVKTADTTGNKNLASKSAFATVSAISIENSNRKF